MTCNTTNHASAVAAVSASSAGGKRGDCGGMRKTMRDAQHPQKMVRGGALWGAARVGASAARGRRRLPRIISRAMGAAWCATDAAITAA